MNNEIPRFHVHYEHHFPHTIGVSRIWQGGGGAIIDFDVWKFACREVMRFARGVPPRKFIKIMQFCLFWCLFWSINGVIWCVLVYILIRFCLKTFLKINILYIKNYECCCFGSLCDSGRTHSMGFQELFRYL